MQCYILMILGLIISSCMVGPDYHPPCLDIPEEYHYEVPDATGDVNALWWHAFDDKVLDDLIAEALANNKDLGIAAANIENAVGVLIQIRAPLFPQIGYDASGTKSRTSKTVAIPLAPTTPNPFTNFQAAGTLDWQIDLWGRIRRQVEAARANLYATEDARRTVILNLVTALADSYLQLRGLDEQLVIAKRTLKSYAELVEYFELQFKHGQVSQMTVEQARTQYELAAVSIPQIELSIVQTENAISILLGSNPKSIPRGKPITEMLVPAVPAGIPSEILVNRPDIQEAEENLIAANALIGAAEALYFPSITLTGDNGVASQQLKNLFKGPSKAWDFTGLITGPIFDWGAVYGQVIQAEAGQMAALWSYEKAIQNAFAEVENALAAHTLLAEQLAAQGRLVKAASEYERLALLQYHGGYSPYFVVLQAQQQLFPAELSWAQTSASLHSSLVNIYQALGGGWVVGAEQISLFEECLP